MAQDPTRAELDHFLEQHPDTRYLEVLAPDISGVLRGKRVERTDFAKLFTKGVNHCGGATLLNIKGAVPEYVSYGSNDGDPDVRGHAVPGSLCHVPWASQPTAQCMMSLSTFAGEPYPFDPRNVLKRALQPLTDRGLRAVVAIELEFYLYEQQGIAIVPRMPKIPGTDLPQDGVQYATFDDLEDVDSFLLDVDRFCAEQNIPAGAALSEYAPGQFEINLHHVEDPVLACDHAALLKRVIRAAARRNGLAATFMAKPFKEFAGSGTHLHVSLLDHAGNNVFAGESQDGAFSDTLRHAIGGLAATLNESMAVMAPNANSYRRYAPGFYAPASPNWGPNHRGVSIRIPVASAKNTRLEYRVPGADANPWLAAAAVLAGMHYGIENRVEPPKMVPEGAEIEYEATIPLRWSLALNEWQTGTVLPDYFGREYHRVFERVRREECDRFNAEISNRDYEWYLRLA
jgi:glutamine synthetase